MPPRKGETSPIPLESKLAGDFSGRYHRGMRGAFTLIFETSTPAASLALLTPDGEILQREFTGDRSHNAVLFSPLAELLSGVPAKDIGLVIAGSGPGSYSGTRVGIAAAQGVAIAAGCPAVAIPSILAVPSVETGSGGLAIGDARRGSFWTARMTDLKLTTQPELTDEAGLAVLVATALEEGLMVTSFEDPARFPLPQELTEKVRLEFPTAARLLRVWENADETTRGEWLSAPPQPMYLKPPHITPAKRPWLVRP